MRTLRFSGSIVPSRDDTLMLKANNVHCTISLPRKLYVKNGISLHQEYEVELTIK